jgi:magnesium transporter
VVRSVLFATKPNEQHRYNISDDEMRAALKDPEGLMWVSLENPDPSEYDLLCDVFQFHPLSIEDCKNDGYQPPKVDDFGSYLFLIAHALDSNKLVDLETQELNLFLGENFVVTVYNGDHLRPIEYVFKRIERDQRVYSYGSDFLCHAVLDAVVDEYMPIIDQMDNEIEWLEDQVLERPEPQTMARILKLKHSIMNLRRIISPMREVVNRLSRDDFPMIDRQSRIYFRDVYDHLVRIQDLSETIRDIVSGTMDIYLNSTSLRLNEVMKALTIVSTIFLPLSFLAGVYGMNFDIQVPGYSNPFGLTIFWLMCLLVVVFMLAFFKRRGWF